MLVAPIDFVRMDQVQKDLVRRDSVHKDYIHNRTIDSVSAPQCPIGYHTDLQEQHLVAGNFDKQRPATVDNFDKGKIEFAPGVAGIHMVVGLHTECGAENQVELEKQGPFSCPVEQTQKDVLGKTEVGPSSWKVALVELGMDLLAQKVELVGC